jgi:NAD(P)-dependent dehydrogenase (short-subunit alcohol dehydrogenase family)
VSALARVIALEYAGHGIRCNSVLPGYMRTPMTEAVLSREHLRERIETNIPMARVADPDEVASVIAFLLSRAASYLTGQEIVVDGGSSLTSFVDSTDVPRLWRNFHSRA